MRISVLLPCWNAERYVGDAVRSILDQDPAPAEIIVVDDGSTDDSRRVVEAFAPHIMLVRQSNRGVAAALNAAAARASGDALAFLDADDLWLPGKLAVQARMLESDLTLDGVFGHMRSFFSPELSENERGQIRVDEKDEPALVKNTLLLRRRAFNRYGAFDEQRRASDFIAWYANASALGFRWKMVPQCVCLRRIHANNMGRRDRERQHSDYLRTMKDLIDRQRAASVRTHD